MQLQSILVAAFFALGVAAQAGCPRDAKLCYDAADLGEPWAPSAKLTFQLASMAQHVLHAIRPRHPVQAVLPSIPFPGRRVAQMEAPIS
ncbi:hypothetical protein MCOR14_001985 [Pyricularia oryzae]|nr:hypothetical protein MCOR17_005140 [Pyricularia oryzae]KAI6498369.1 hypothetical protein MCOR13_006504 [Pyricularia oryzae]KAI6643581.1 hypothetical protein MCOR14_001985 [Pyricularia oryzae]